MSETRGEETPFVLSFAPLNSQISQSTIVYGTSNAGSTIHDGSAAPEFMLNIRKAAKCLNLVSEGGGREAKKKTRVYLFIYFFAETPHSKGRANVHCSGYGRPHWCGWSALRMNNK